MEFIVLNLLRNLSKSDLVNLFETYSTITACNLVTDEETAASKGFGFIEMAHGEEAEKAAEELFPVSAYGPS